MNNTIILSELAAAVAELTQCTVEDAEYFIRETFRLAAEKLEADRRVVIPGVGTFVVTDENIAFAPEQSLAVELNAPFAAFEAVELPEEYDDEKVGEEPVEPFEQTQEIAEMNIDEPEPEVTEEIVDDDSPEEDEPEAVAETAEFDENEDAAESEEQSVAVVSTTHAYHHWIWAAACLLCFVFGWFARGFAPDMRPVQEIQTAETDTIESVEPREEPDYAPAPEAAPMPEEPVRAVTTDTIAPGRFLTTMARAHYGRMEFWVYIYEANVGNLGHPDRLSAGTVVVIPPADSLGLNVNDEARIAEAERKAAEIYARFN